MDRKATINIGSAQELHLNATPYLEAQCHLERLEPFNNARKRVTSGLVKGVWGRHGIRALEAPVLSQKLLHGRESPVTFDTKRA